MSVVQFNTTYGMYSNTHKVVVEVWRMSPSDLRIILVVVGVSGGTTLHRVTSVPLVSLPPTAAWDIARRWHHIAWTWRTVGANMEISLYVDGVRAPDSPVN
ncbi:MAG: hypothetical protein HY608_01065, partial [Planctomycetes bacterium]|nr:hypothetical protein [Planctomycetota bacterium]